MFAQTFSVSAGASHSVASGNGAAWSWGANTSGQLGDDTITARLQPGTLVGSGGFPNVLILDKVSAGANHNLGTSYPSVRAWGDNAYGQLGHNDTVDAHRSQTYFVSSGVDQEFMYAEQSAGSNHSLARNGYGEIYESGLAASLGLAANVLWPVRVAEGAGYFTGATAIAAGGSHSLALRSGVVYSWGTNTNAQLGYTAGTGRSAAGLVVGIPTGTTIVAIAAGGLHSMALDSTGSIWTWGGNVYGQLGVGTTTATGGLAPAKITLSPAVTFVAIAAGAHFSAALDASGNVWTWGRNAQGQLGYTPLTNQLVPKQILSFGNIIAIGSGPAASHTLAVKNTGEVWAWGLNTSGQLGTGNTAATTGSAPAPCSGLYLISQAPTVSIKTPLTGTTVAAASNVEVDVAAIDANGITHVDLAVDGVVVATDSTFPLRLTWENAVAGTHQLTAIAYNTRGQQTTSSAVQVIVSAPPAGGKVAAPVLSVEGGVFATGQDVIVRAPTPSSVIHYTNDDADPTESDPSIASGTVLWVDHTTTLRFRAFRSGYVTSDLKEARYRISGAVAAGSNHTVAVDAAARLWTWGDNSQSQLGQASTTDSKTPILLDYHNFFRQTSPAAVSAGGTHTGVLMKDGTYFFEGDVAPSVYPGGPVTSIAAGTSHYIVAIADGRMAAWGDNSKGQLGDGSTTDRAGAVYVNFIGGVVGTAAGELHSIALRSDGSVWTWGDNTYGQLGFVPATVPKSSLPMRLTALDGKDVIAVAAGLSHSLALLRDGTVYSWGRNSYRQLGTGASYPITYVSQPTLIPGLTGVTAIAGGAAHCVACTQDGSVYTWGYNFNGELGLGNTTNVIPPTKVPGIFWAVSVTAGHNHTCVVTEDGVVWSFGYNLSGQVGDNTLVSRTSKTLTANLRLTGAFQVSAGQDHNLGLQDTGVVWSWGANSNGQLSFADHLDGAFPRVIPGLEGIVSIAAGGNFSLALGSEGTVYSWGANDTGQLGDGTTADHDAPTPINGLTDIINIGAGRNLAVARDSEDRLWLWGNWQTSYTSGVAIYTPYTAPQLISNGTVPTGHVLTVGDNHVALLSQSTVVLGGSNLYGQLAQGNNYLSTYGFGWTPSGFTGVIDVASGDNHIVALKGDGTVWCWGRNHHGQIGVNTSTTTDYKTVPTQVKSSTTTTPLTGAQTTVTVLTGVISVAASGDTSYAMKADGSVWAWGANGGKFGAFSTIGESWAAVKVIAASTTLYNLAAGRAHALGLQRDGTVQSWGDNSRGQLGIYGGTGATPAVIPNLDLLFNDDVDGDGFTLQQELANGTDPLQLDSDGDGLTDAQEIALGTNPFLADTDGDGISDGLEVQLKLDPRVSNASSDHDGDGVSDLQEALQGTDPLNGVNLTVFTKLE